MRLSELAKHFTETRQEAASAAATAASGAAKVLADTEISGIAEDSRMVNPGDLFFAIPGTKHNGMQFCEEAVSRGAAALVIPMGSRQSINTALPQPPVLEVENPRRALALAAAARWPRQPGIVAAITGTNGKTSIAEFTRQIWDRVGWQAASIGTLGVRGGIRPDTINTRDGRAHPIPTLTTPDAISCHKVINSMVQAGTDCLAIEASSHGLEQHRLDGMRLTAAAFSNLSHDHLDHHKDMDAYFEAKVRLFTELLPDGGGAVINLDDPWGRKLLSRIRNRNLYIQTFGKAEDADFRITGIKTQAGAGKIGSITLEVTRRGKRYILPLAMAGRFQADNALTAAALAHVAGMSVQDSLMNLPYIKPASGRMTMIPLQQRHGHESNAMVIIDYAHTPDALEAALGTLKQPANETSENNRTGRLAVVFGCGGDRDSQKRPKMGAAVARHADWAIITDDNPRSEDPAAIRAQIRAGISPDDSITVDEIGNRHDAIREAISRLEEGDCLLIAGKGHEDTQLIGSETLPFNDETEVRAILASMQTTAPLLTKGEIVKSITGGAGKTKGSPATKDRPKTAVTQNMGTS